jgi:protein involved in polysaccharide export with SLBB domain
MNTVACSHPNKFYAMRMLARLLLSLTLIAFAACATPGYEPVLTPEAQSRGLFNAKHDYLIQAGDQIDIKLFFNPELNDIVTVRPDGKISLQLLDDVQAAGLTPAQLDEAITRSYAREVKNPVVTVILRGMAEPRVYVGGDVEKPGYVAVNTQTGVLQAIVQAGGFLDSADMSEVQVLRKGPDSRPIPVHIDVDKILSGAMADADYPLQSTDVIYVPRRGVVKVADFMHQISKILLLNGFFLAL